MAAARQQHPQQYQYDNNNQLALQPIQEPVVRRPWKAVAVPRVSDYTNQDKASSILSPAIKNQQKHPRKKYIADYLNADSGSEQHEILNLTRNSMASSQTSQGGNLLQNQPNLIMRHISGQKVPGNPN